MTEKITLIIPVRLTGATHEGEMRLSRICGAVPRDLFDILISDYGTPGAHRGALDMQEAGGVRVVRHPSPHSLFSIGQARDFGVQMSRTPVVMFNDIDFLGTPAMYRAIHAEVLRRGMSRNLFDFFCVPVLFLTEEGTRAWRAAPEDGKLPGQDLSVEALEADVRVQTVAYGSSAMVVNRHHYLSLGGHDPRFTGHGAEDYDLLHRLATLAPTGPRPRDYFTDYKDNGVRSYWGFRAWFALYGLELLPRGVHLVHLWHPRRKERGYFRPGRNFRLLRRVMKRFDQAGAQPMPLAHIEGAGGDWLVVCHTARDLDLVRQLLPLSSRYRLLRARSHGAAARRLGRLDADGVASVVATPDVGGRVADLAASLPSSARLLVFDAPDVAGRVRVRDGAGAIVGSGTVARAQAPSGRPVMTYWREFDVVGLPPFATGEIPVAQEAGSRIFDSFGAAQVLGLDGAKRPRRKKKSPVHIRFWRWLTRT